MCPLAVDAAPHPEGSTITCLYRSELPSISLKSQSSAIY